MHRLLLFVADPVSYLQPSSPPSASAPLPQAPVPPPAMRFVLYGPAADDLRVAADHIAARHGLPVVDLTAAVSRRVTAAAAAAAAAAAGGPDYVPPPHAIHRHSLAAALYAHLSKGETVPRRLLVRTALLEVAALHILRLQHAAAAARPPGATATPALDLSDVARGAWDHIADPAIAAAAEAAEAQAAARETALAAAAAAAKDKATKKKLSAKKEAEFLALERTKAEAEWAKRVARAGVLTAAVEACAEAAEADLDPEEVAAMSVGVDADPHARFARSTARLDMAARTGFAAALGGGLSAATLGHATRLSHVVPPQVGLIEEGRVEGGGGGAGGGREEGRMGVSVRPPAHPIRSSSARRSS